MANNKHSSIKDRAEQHGDNYLLKNVFIRTKQGKHRNTFFGDGLMLSIHHSSYPVRFVIPNNQLVYWETNQPLIRQCITITKWAYKHCYLRAINLIVKKHQKYLFSLLQLDAQCTMLLGNPYKPLVEEIQEGK